METLWLFSWIFVIHLAVLGVKVHPGWAFFRVDTVTEEIIQRPFETPSEAQIPQNSVSVYPCERVKLGIWETMIISFQSS